MATTEAEDWAKRIVTCSLAFKDFGVDRYTLIDDIARALDRSYNQALEELEKVIDHHKGLDYDVKFLISQNKRKP